MQGPFKKALSRLKKKLSILSLIKPLRKALQDAAAEQKTNCIN